MGERLGGQDRETLGVIADFLDNMHRFMASLPMVLERHEDIAALRAYKGCAQSLREMAADIDKGRKAPMRVQSALRQVAGILERAVETNQPGEIAPLRKSELLVN